MEIPFSNTVKTCEKLYPLIGYWREGKKFCLYKACEKMTFFQFGDFGAITGGKVEIPFSNTVKTCEKLYPLIGF